MSNELMNIDNKALSAINATLEALEKSGELKVSEIYPSLTPVLSSRKAGGYPGKPFLGKIRAYNANVELPSVQDPDVTKEADVLEVQDVAGDYNGTVFNFYAGNGGLKAKIRAIKDFPFVFLAFRGENENETPGMNPWKDWFVVGFKSKEAGMKLVDLFKKQIPAQVK